MFMTPIPSSSDDGIDADFNTVALHFALAGTTLHQPWYHQGDDGLASPAIFWHVTLDKKHKVKPHVLQFVFCITLHNRNGAAIVCWCLHSIQTTACFQTSNFLWVWTQISLTSSLFGHVLVQACHTHTPPPLNRKIPTCLFISFCAPCLF